MTDATIARHRGGIATALIVLWLLLAVWGLSLTYTKPTDLALAAQQLTDMVTRRTIWVAAWAWATFSLRGQSFLATHVFIVAVASLVGELMLNLGLPWLYFVMGWPRFLELDRVCWTILIVATSVFHLRVAFERLRGRVLALWALSSTLFACLFLASTWVSYNNSDGLKWLPYKVNVFPAYWVKTPDKGLDDGLKELWGKGWVVNGER